MRERRLHHLVAGPPPAADRILWSGLWFRDHNNVRYSELMPRLERVDAYLVHAAGARIPRGVQYRAYRSPLGGLGQRLIGPVAARRYRALLCTEFRQIAAFPGPVVVDVDDADFSERELELFTRPNVVALVTTTGWAAKRFRELGVSAPVEVIEQGAPRPPTPQGCRPPRAAGELVVGYLAAWLFSEGDRGAANPNYNVDHLLDLWDAIHVRLPGARLLLVGGPGKALTERVAGRADIELVGRIPRERVFGVLAKADLAVYPRRTPAGIAVAKVADYLAAGLPVVSYDEPNVAAQLAPTGAAVVVASPGEFVAAVERLAGDLAERERLAEAARTAGAALDWDVLARRYETEILDRYLA